MITPENYVRWPEPLERLSEELEDFIISDICRQIKQDGYITATAEIQMSALMMRGYNPKELQDKIAEFLGLADSEIQDLYEKAAAESQRFEDEVYEKLGKEPVKLEDNEDLQNQLRAEAQQTANTFKNLTQSLGFTVKDGGKTTFLPAADVYQHILDRAQLESLSGGITASEAIKRAVRDLASSGLKTVSYASGHVDQMDVAVRRAIVTGMNQIAEKVNDQTVEQFESPLVEVSAHGGARDSGSGYQNHKAWQGKVYYWAEKDKWGREDLKRKYPDFVRSTGYGQVDGLEGANCRHSKRVFIDGVSERMWTQKQLDEIDKPDFTYNGKEYTTYEATQRQRLLERTQRKYKRQILAYEALGVGKEDPMYQQAALKLQTLSNEYKQFSKAAGLRTQPERAQIYGYGVKQAGQVRSAATIANKEKKDNS